MKQLYYRFLSFITLAISCVSYLQAGEEILIYKKGNSEPHISLWVAKRPTITYTPDGIEFKSPELKKPVLLSLTKISRIEFKESVDKTPDDIVSDIEEQSPIGMQTLRFNYMHDNQITIEGIGDNSVISLYGINGQRKPLDASYITNGVTVNLSHLPKGYYIITVDKQPFKIYKK